MQILTLQSLQYATLLFFRKVLVSPHCCCTKALMQNAGVEGEIYPDFKPFISEERRKHLGSRLSNTSLMPITRSLNHRLNKSLGHWLLSPALNHIKKSNCQLHYWTTGKWNVVVLHIVSIVGLVFALISSMKCFIRCGILEVRRKT